VLQTRKGNYQENVPDRQEVAAQTMTQEELMEWLA